MIAKYTVLIFIAISFFGFSQKIKYFEDEIGIMGEFRYSGDFNEDVRLPRNGNIEIRWRNAIVDDLITFKVKGQTKEYIPIGKWIWEEANWNYKINVGSSIAPNFDARAERSRWEGNFVNGNPEGKWIFTLDSINGSGKPFGKSLQINITYKNAKPVGPLSVIDNFTKNNLKLTGFCDTNGLATGVWLYSFKDKKGALIKEERVYKNGLLLEIRSFEGLTKNVLKFDLNHQFIYNKVDNDDSFTLGELKFQQDEFGGISSELFHESLTEFFLKGWQLSEFKYSFKRELPMFKRLKYPLTVSELDKLATCKELIDKQNKAISEVLASNIDFHRSRSQELDTTISYLELHRKRLTSMDSLLKRVDLPFFTYKNRYTKDIEGWISKLNSLRFQKGEVYDSLFVQIPFISTNQSDSIFIFQVFLNELRQNEEKLPKYFHVIEDAHILVNREGELKALENRMVECFREQAEFYESQEGIGALIYQKWLKNEIQNQLITFTQTDDYDDALRLGNSVVTMLDSLDRWQSEVVLFDNMQRLLKSNYSYLAYNPYTGVNDIEIINKKKFYNTIQTVLWPYLINQIQEENDWVSWNMLWQRQFMFYSYLMDFSPKEDTHSKRINKKLKNESKPEKIVKVLEQESKK